MFLVDDFFVELHEWFHVWTADLWPWPITSYSWCNVNQSACLTLSENHWIVIPPSIHPHMLVYLQSDTSSEMRGWNLLRPLLSARENTASSSLGEEIIPPSFTHSQSANVTGVWACVCVKMPDGWWHETLFHVWLCLVSWGGEWVCDCVC